ncbi:MAG: MogA/MoaB family molybdenum cofactor biosynthesis protein [bacterium]|nr:MogA/MoaB family molybdenum cofactor biosynthesis protein [bacterium]MDT8396495.1 MogA/MoaB family molybdenum cofactor biosynthesis protein [bacterium]
MKVRAGVLTLSDRSSRGEYEDLSGPSIVRIMDARPEFDIVWEQSGIIPDEEPLIVETLRRWCDEDGLDLIITTGGTGPAPRDRTPEATRKVLDFEIPGIPEAMRAAVRDRVPTSVLTRGLTGVRGQTLIVNLPGSPRAVMENMEVLFGFLEHLIEKIKGDPSECGSK